MTMEMESSANPVKIMDYTIYQDTAQLIAPMDMEQKKKIPYAKNANFQKNFS